MVIFLYPTAAIPPQSHVRIRIPSLVYNFFRLVANFFRLVALAFNVFRLVVVVKVIGRAVDALPSTVVVYFSLKMNELALKTNYRLN